MTKANFFRYYNKLSAADAYILFFVRHGFLYRIDLPHIPQKWTIPSYERSSAGGHQKWRIYIPAKDRDKAIKTGKAQLVMTEAEFMAINEKNNGHKCERYLHELYNIPGEYHSDTVPFDIKGDICINGKQYQVKFENASMTNVHALHEAQARARARKKIEKMQKGA